MKDTKRYPSTSKLHSLYFAKLVFGLFHADPMYSEAPLGVIYEAEVLPGFLNRKDIHVTNWIGVICADLSIDLYEPLHEDSFRLAPIKSVF